MSSYDAMALTAARDIISAAVEVGFVLPAEAAGDDSNSRVFEVAAAAATFLAETQPPQPTIYLIAMVDGRPSAYTLDRRGDLVEAEVDLPVSGTIDVAWDHATECDPLRGGDAELQAALGAALLRLRAEASGS